MGVFIGVKKATSHSKEGTLPQKKKTRPWMRSFSASINNLRGTDRSPPPPLGTRQSKSPQRPASMANRAAV